MTKLSLNTRRAIKNYGEETCRIAFEKAEQGCMTITAIAFTTAGLRTIKQADAAINAGRELAFVKCAVRALIASTVEV